MKQFSLDEYLKDPLKKVVTRDGRRARIVCTDRVLGAFGVLALVMEKSGIENSYSYKTNGQYYEKGISDLDLFFAPEKHEGWINVFEDALEGNYVGDRLFKTKESAEKEGKRWIGHKAVVKIEWEE